jgi:hypothetical protein
VVCLCRDFDVVDVSSRSLCTRRAHRSQTYIWGDILPPTQIQPSKRAYLYPSSFIHRSASILYRFPYVHRTFLFSHISHTKLLDAIIHTSSGNSSHRSGHHHHTVMGLANQVFILIVPPSAYLAESTGTCVRGSQEDNCSLPKNAIQLLFEKLAPPSHHLERVKAQAFNP